MTNSQRAQGVTDGWRIIKIMWTTSKHNFGDPPPWSLKLFWKHWVFLCHPSVHLQKLRDHVSPLTGLTPDRLDPPSHDASPVSPEPSTPGAQSPSHLHYHSKAQHRRFSMEVSNRGSKSSCRRTRVQGLTGKVLTLASCHAVVTCCHVWLLQWFTCCLSEV